MERERIICSMRKTNKKGERGRDGGNRDRYRRVRDKKMNISLGERERENNL